MGQYFSSHLSHFFCCIIRKYLSHILFCTQLVSVCYTMKLYFLLQNTLDTNVTFVSYLGWAIFFHRHTCRAFFAVSSKNIYPTYCFGHSPSQSVSQWNSFSPLKYIVYKCFSFFRPGMALFVSSSHLSRFFCCIIRKYLSHILFWSQLVSVCFGMKFFSSFKIYCLQMLQLFQTRDGPIFFIVTLVYTCRAFFAVSSENICPIYCFGHSSSQSVSQWNSFPPLKYIVYKCYSCFRPRMGQFFSSSHLSTLVGLFLLYHQKIFIPYIVLVTVRLSLFRNEILFLL